MRWQTFAAYLDRLEATRSRRTSVAVVAELLKSAGAASVGEAVYLLQGQLRPAYEGIEIGVGAKLLVQVLAQAYATSQAAVTRRYRTMGDLGLVAENLARPTRAQSLTVRQVHRAMLAVGQITGSGSIERKIAALAALLRRTGAEGAKYLVRILQGRLRLGVGDQTILEAAAVAALGDAKKKTAIEHAYNVRTDLGAVIQAAFAGGERALARMTPRPGVPVRPALAQRLRSAEEIVERLGTVAVEPKYDGFRLQLHRDGNRTWAFSRRLENVTDMFPELTAGLRRQLRARRAIIEGEAVGYRPDRGEFLPFQVTMTRKRKSGIAGAAARLPLHLFAFDLLYADGRNYLIEPQRERGRRLRQLLRGTPRDPLVVTASMTTGRADEVQAYFDDMIRQGLEGIVAKQPDAAYQAGARQYAWVKLKRAYQQKLRDTVDVVIVGYLVGRGKRAALGIGSLLAAVYDPEHDRFRTVAKIGSGLSDQEWRALRTRLRQRAVPAKPKRVDARLTPDVWVEPKYVVEVLADEITRSPLHTCGKTGDQPGYALRFPRMLKGVRTDKAPEDATTEQEILDLYRLAHRRKPRPRAAAGRRHRA